mmetsp:Transcript_64830/g.107781  ORF Transcript_64830/g.107781 Transcript_64830/m.107781 type:complete len:191 (-) Transcript_64830:645-1217(-)
MLIHVEPSVPMDELVRVALAHNVLPQVVLEFPGITAGGALGGGAIESSSFRFGTFFDTVQEVDVLLGNSGEFHEKVSRTHMPDLFHCLNASYGSQAIVTRLALRVVPAAPYVHVRYLHFGSLEAATSAMESIARLDDPPDFLDGVGLSSTSAMVVVGWLTEEKPELPFLSLRRNRWDVWFAWHLHDLARK